MRRIFAGLVLVGSLLFSGPAFSDNPLCESMTTQVVAKGKETLRLINEAGEIHNDMRQLAKITEWIVWFRGGGARLKYFTALNAKSYRLAEAVRGGNRPGARLLVQRVTVEVEFAVHNIKLLRREIRKLGLTKESPEYPTYAKQIEAHEKILGWLIHDFTSIHRTLAELKEDPALRAEVELLQRSAGQEIAETLPAELKSRVRGVEEGISLKEAWDVYNDVIPGVYPMAAYWRYRRILSSEWRQTTVGLMMRVATANSVELLTKALSHWVPKTFLNRVPLIAQAGRMLADTFAYHEHYELLNPFLVGANRAATPEAMYPKLKEAFLAEKEPLLVTFMRRADTVAIQQSLIQHVQELVTGGNEKQAMLDVLLSAQKSADTLGPLSSSVAPISPQDLVVWAAVAGIGAYSGAIENGGSVAWSAITSTFQLAGPTPPGSATLSMAELREVVDAVDVGVANAYAAWSQGDVAAGKDLELFMGERVRQK